VRHSNSPFYPLPKGVGTLVVVGFLFGPGLILYDTDAVELYTVILIALVIFLLFER